MCILYKKLYITCICIILPTGDGTFYFVNSPNN